ncbi:MAG: helix-turn-helix domain-containing protein [Opitutaceae bacterium]|jgi:transcriptional regulator with XRE-family HTH domain
MQTIGERLEEARKRKGISLREAAEGTKIRGDYLLKFEGNQYDLNLPEIYVRGFLRTYANFLKLSGDKIVADFAALGHGAARSGPRMPSREIYGRMDLSVASGPGTPAVEAQPEPAADAPAQPEQQQPSPRRMSQPFRDNATGRGVPVDVILKFAGAIIGVIAVAFLIAWGVKLVFFGGEKKAPTVTTGDIVAAQPLPERTITLVALDLVHVTVTQKNADGTPGNTLFEGTLARGQSQTVPWPGPIYISANAGENLQIEYKGKVYSSQFLGNGRAQMD